MLSASVPKPVFFLYQKQPQSGINTRMQVLVSPVGDEDAGGAGGLDGAGGAGGVCMRDI